MPKACLICAMKWNNVCPHAQLTELLHKTLFKIERNKSISNFMLVFSKEQQTMFAGSIRQLLQRE